MRGHHLSPCPLFNDFVIFVHETLDDGHPKCQSNFSHLFRIMYIWPESDRIHSLPSLFFSRWIESIQLIDPQSPCPCNTNDDKTRLQDSPFVCSRQIVVQFFYLDWPERLNHELKDLSINALRCRWFMMICKQNSDNNTHYYNYCFGGGHRQSMDTISIRGRFPFLKKSDWTESIDGQLRFFGVGHLWARW